MKKSQILQQELDDLKQEFQEQVLIRFKEQSKEYEELLESELSEKERKIEELELELEISKEKLQDYIQKYTQNEQQISKYQQERDQTLEKIKTFELHKRELEQLNDYWENSARVLEFYKQDLEEKLYNAEENAILYKEELDEINQRKEIEVQRLRDQCTELRDELNLLYEQHSDKVPKLEEKLKLALDELEAYKQRPAESFDNRVQVMIRVRPQFQGEGDACIQEQGNEIQVNKLIGPRQAIGSKTFAFEKIFAQHETQDDVFQYLQAGIEGVIYGKKFCILAYGQTGSGKTYTMQGLLERTLIRLQQMKQDEACSVYCVEIYNEQVRNLIDPENFSKSWRETIQRAERTLPRIRDALEVIQEAGTRRVTKFTESNSQSSRSHAIYTIKICEGLIQFVDLAGSERLNKSKASGDTLSETLSINKSLTALQDVISALENKSNHIPFRNSILTQVLQPSLTGMASQVAMILNVSPSSDSMNETICTLSLGSRLKTIELRDNFRKSLTLAQVERTYELLEKERSEKNILIRKIEKLERDVDYYKNAILERDNKVKNLTMRVKQQGRMNNNENDSLWKEIRALKMQLDEVNKKLKRTQAALETERKAKTRIVQKAKQQIYQRPGSRPPSAPPKFDLFNTPPQVPPRYKFAALSSISQVTRLPRPSSCNREQSSNNSTPKAKSQ